MTFDKIKKADGEEISVLAVILPERKPSQQDIDNILADIQANYLYNPILVRRSGHRYKLLDGLVRLYAFKKLGRRTIPALIVE